MYSILGVGYGFSVAGIIHLVAKRPYIVAVIGLAILGASLMKPVPPPPLPSAPPVPVNWSGNWSNRGIAARPLKIPDEGQ
jgi:hypothetical protein